MLGITDSGTGMNREVAARAFEPFFTTKPVGQGTGLGLAIVFVEDDPAVAASALLSLRGLGYQVIAASGGEEALERTRNVAHVELLITDVVMPNMGGVELARLMSQRYASLAVLFTSGYTENAIVHHGVLAKGINFLPKPYSRSALLEKIREVLDAAANGTSPT
jgi:two-component system, cell cycle sensor histidine kinase and response regulator CckA